MINTPIFCYSCGAIYPSGILVENFANETLDDIKGSCPFCGGLSQVPSDVYNFIGSIIELLNVPDKTADKLNKLALILRGYRNTESGVNEISTKIEQEIPKFTSIVDLLPREDAYQHIQIILFIITIIISLTTGDQQEPITTEKIIEELYKHLTPSNTFPADSGDKENFQVTKVGRNKLCPCGSGKKYKKCCGNI